jgi:hypothetical protein
MLIIDYAERAHRHFWEIFILIIFCLDKKLTDYICFGLNHDKIRVSSKKGYAAVYVIMAVITGSLWLYIGSAINADDTYKKVSACYKLYSGRCSYVEDTANRSHSIDYMGTMVFFVKSNQKDLYKLISEIVVNDKEVNSDYQLRDVHVNYIPGSSRYNLYEGEEPFGNVKVESSIFPVKKLIITWDAITLDRLNTEQS